MSEVQCVQAISNSKGERAESASEAAVGLNFVDELWNCWDCRMVVRAGTTIVDDLQMWLTDQLIVSAMMQAPIKFL